MIEDLIQAWREAESLAAKRFDEDQELAASGTYTPEDEKRSYEALQAARDAYIILGSDLAEILGNRVYVLPDGRFLVPVSGPINDSVEILEAYRPGPASDDEEMTR